MSGPFRIGIDLGGTKIEGAAVDVSGSMRVRRRLRRRCRTIVQRSTRSLLSSEASNRKLA